MSYYYDVLRMPAADYCNQFSDPHELVVELLKMFVNPRWQQDGRVRPYYWSPSGKGGEEGKNCEHVVGVLQDNRPQMQASLETVDIQYPSGMLIDTAHGNIYVKGSTVTMTTLVISYYAQGQWHSRLAFYPHPPKIKFRD